MQDERAAYKADGGIGLFLFDLFFLETPPCCAEPQIFQGAEPATPSGGSGLCFWCRIGPLRVSAGTGEASIQHRRIGVAGSDCKFAGRRWDVACRWDLRRRWDRGNERVFSDAAALAAGIVNRAAGCRFLAAAAGKAVCGEAELFERGLVDRPSPAFMTARL
jgi:hypothetical protein